MAEINQKEYHYDEDEIKTRAIESLKRCKPYQKLYSQMERLDPRKDFVKLELVKTQLRKMENDEIRRFVELEDKRRRDVNVIADLLKQFSPDDARMYQQLMTSLSFCIDMLDYIFNDINGLLCRNNIGVKMEQFPELKAAWLTMSDIADKEIGRMPDYKKNEYVPECDRLYDHLKERARVYVRKINRYEMAHPELTKTK